MKFFRLFFMIFILFFLFSCGSFSRVNRCGSIFVDCPAPDLSVSSIKSYISSVNFSDQRLMDLFVKVRDGIFSSALVNLNLDVCKVQPMYVWMNFCEGLKNVRGTTALTFGYRGNGFYKIVLLVDSSFSVASDSVVAELIAHEIIHAYCDHNGLDAGDDFHHGWFDVIASEIESLSKVSDDPLYACMGNLYRK